MPRRLVMMAGLTGTGKSALARALGRELRWPVVDKDVFKSRLLNTDLPDKVAGGMSYDLTLSLADDLLLGQGLSVIVDSPALYPEVTERAASIAASGDALLKVVYCVLDIETRSVRLRRRVGLRSQPSAPHAHEGYGLDLFSHLPTDTLHVVTDRPVAELLPVVLTYVCAG